MPRRVASSCLSLALLVLTACSRPAGSPPSSAPPSSATSPPPSNGAAAPTAQELANATYTGFAVVPDTVQLTAGRWEGPDEDMPMRASVTLREGPLLTGDLTHDGKPDAVAVLHESGGGSGTFTHFAVMSRAANGLVVAGMADLRDRTRIRSLRLEGDTLVADLIEAGENDPACCPGDLVTRRWTMKDGRLSPVALIQSGRFVAAMLAGTSWTLSDWNGNEPAPVDPALQLTFTSEGVTGQAGCNSFRGSFRGEDVGALTFGPLATTRKACPPPQMEIETRFLKALANVQSFDFSVGGLTLGVQSKDGMSWMSFSPAAEPTR